MNKPVLILTSYLFILLITLASCSSKGKGIAFADYKSINGYVIGREICHTDESQDDWLIDFTYGENQPQIGDTITIDGIHYTNVVKVKGLGPRLRRAGLAVRIDYKVISSGIVIPTECNHPDAFGYSLKQLIVLHQSEHR